MIAYAICDHVERLGVINVTRKIIKNCSDKGCEIAQMVFAIYRCEFLGIQKGALMTERVNFFKSAAYVPLCGHFQDIRFRQTVKVTIERCRGHVTQRFCQLLGGQLTAASAMMIRIRMGCNTRSMKFSISPLYNEITISNIINNDYIINNEIVKRKAIDGGFGDRQQRAADISIKYPDLVSNYRAAREIAVEE